MIQTEHWETENGKETKVTYIHWPFKLKMFAKLESLHVIVSHTRIVV